MKIDIKLLVILGILNFSALSGFCQDKKEKSREDQDHKTQSQNNQGKSDKVEDKLKKSPEFAKDSLKSLRKESEKIDDGDDDDDDDDDKKDSSHAKKDKDLKSESKDNNGNGYGKLKDKDLQSGKEFGKERSEAAKAHKVEAVKNAEVKKDEAQIKIDEAKTKVKAAKEKLDKDIANKSITKEEAESKREKIKKAELIIKNAEDKLDQLDKVKSEN